MSAISLLCNYLYNENKTRFGLLDIVHVSDVITCPVRVFLDRIFGSPFSCPSLGLMYIGRAFEKLVSNIIPDYEYQKELHGILQFEEAGKKREFKLIATPDFQKETEVLEVKYTTHPANEVQEQSKSHHETMEGLGLDIPPLTGLHDEIEWLPVYYSWMIQLAAYTRAKNPKMVSRASLLVLYQDKIFQFDFERERKAKLLDFYTIFRAMLPETILALRLADRWRYINQTIGEWETGHMILEDLVYTIWANAIRTYHLLKYYQCERCPYWRLGICPGLPPLRTPNEEDQARIVHLLSWLAKYKLEREISKQWEKAIETTMDKLKGVVARAWLKAIKERPRIQLTIEQIMAGRRRPTAEQRKLAILEKIQEATKIDVWSQTLPIKIPTQWLMRTLNEIGKPILTPKQIAIIRNHGEVVRGMLFPAPTPEDYRLSKQALIIFIKWLQKVVPEMPTEIKNIKAIWEWEVREHEARGGEITREAH